MKKFLVPFLAVMLLTAACSPGKQTSSNESSTEATTSESISEAEETTTKETEKSTTTEDETTDNETSDAEETFDSSEGINYSYEETEPIKVTKINGQTYFDYTVDEFLTLFNNKNMEVLTSPGTYTLSEETFGEDNLTVLTGDNGIICLLDAEPETKKIARVMIASEKSMTSSDEEDSISSLAFDALPALMVLDPNIETNYGAMHLLDIAMAGQIKYGESQYAYEGTHGSIEELLYGEEGLTIISFAPVQ